MSDLSLQSVKAFLVEKEGYTSTPSHSSLRTLETLMYNMYAYRSRGLQGQGLKENISGVICIAHSTPRADPRSYLSLKGIMDMASSLKLCSCNSEGAPSCECKSKIDCVCVSRTSCTCRATEACTCVNDDDYYWWTCYGHCGCDNRTAQPTCACDVDQGGSYCSCEDVYPGQPEYCSCYDRISEPACSCVSENPVWKPCTSNCGCHSRTSPCTGKTTSPTCPSNIDCTCNNRCACNAAQKFE